MAQEKRSATPASQQKNIVEVKLEYPQKTTFEYFTPYFPVIATILGWWIVSRQNDRRERRKDVRELLKQAELHVDAAISLANEFYSLPGKDPKCNELSAKIRYKLSALDPLRQRLEAYGLKCDALKEIIIFRQSITGGDFESLARKKLTLNSNLLAEVSASGFALISKLEQSYLAAVPVRVHSWF